MRTGAALPAVLFALAITGALAIGGVYVTRQLAAAARYSERGALIEPAAAWGLADVIANWDSTLRRTQPFGEPAPVLRREREGIRTEAWVTRFSSTAYWIVAESEVVIDPALRRRVSVLVHVADSVPRPVPHRAWSELP
jgi:hypothetical protein